MKRRGCGLVLLLFGLVACNSDAAACRRLSELCPAPGNRERCVEELEAVRQTAGSEETARRRDCMATAPDCITAAGCLAPDGSPGWTSHPPLQ